MVMCMKKFIFKNYKTIIILFCLTCFIALSEDVFEKEVMNGDIIGYNLVSKYLINENLTPFVKIITNFGGFYFLIGLSVVLFIVIKNKKIGCSIFSNLIIITIFNQLFKFILQRPRPEEFRIINETGYSFPSGHSMISMAFYGYLIYLIYTHINNKYLKWFLITFLSSLIIFIGLSRIYLGVHYTSDVIAGFAVSLAYLIVFIKISEKMINRRSINEK